MQIWEYMTLTLTNIRDSGAELNAWGKQGWELVSVAAVAPNLGFAFLKRPVPSCWAEAR